MASVVDICNLALARLGDSATVVSIDPPEGSAQAERCARFYPIALDSMLESHTWKFATRRARLALLSNADTWEWAYAYAIPNNMIRAIAVIPPHADSEAKSEPYRIEAGENDSMILFTDVENATLRYTVRVNNPTVFSPLATDALGWLLASHLAGPMLKGDAGAAESKRCLQAYASILGAAKVSDANQQKIEPEHTPDWIKDR